MPDLLSSLAFARTDDVESLRSPEAPALLRPPLEDIACPAALLDACGIVTECNDAWLAATAHAPALAEPYLDGLRQRLPAESEAAAELSRFLDAAAHATTDVINVTVACHGSDSERWVGVNISTVSLGGRRAWLVLHQDVTPLRLLERRLLLARRLATVQAASLDPGLRARRLAVTVGEVLQASVVVLWERNANGVLRARPLETSWLSPQVATIAHTRQILGVMDGRSAQWMRLPDGAPCYAVPLKLNELVLLLHFPQRPRFDVETLRLVTRALQTDPSLRHESPVRHGSPRAARRKVGPEVDAASPRLAEHERLHIEKTLAQCGNNVLRTAAALGIARSTLYERFKDYGMKVPPRARPERV